MAKTHAIYDAQTTSTFNFLTGDLYVIAWEIGMAQDGWVIETLELAARGKADADIISAGQALGSMAEAVAMYWEYKWREPVWYRVYADSEHPKQALIQSIQFAQVSRSRFTPLLGQMASFYRVQITRSATWEDLSAESVLSAVMPCYGGYELIGEIDGDLPARIARVIFSGVGGVQTLTEIWAGIRPHETPSRAVSLGAWPLEGGTLGADAVLPGNDPTAMGVGSNYVRVNFNTNANLVKRVGVIANDTGVPGNYKGRWVVLLRCKLTGAGRAAVQLKTGFQTGGNFMPRPKQIVDWTGWKLTNLGTIDFSYRPGSYVDLNFLELQIWAERISGSASLDLDNLILIPGYHYIHASGNIVNSSSGIAAIFHTYPDGSTLAVNANAAGRVSASVSPDFTDWRLPSYGGTLVVAAQGSTHNINDTISVNVVAVPRFRLYGEA